MKDSISVQEFNEMVKRGLIASGKRGRMVKQDLLPEYEQELKEWGVDVAYPDNKINHKHPYLTGNFKIEQCKDDIFIPFNVPSSKNGRVWTGTKSIKSKTCYEYEKLTESYYKKNKDKFIKLIKDKTFPIVVGFYFYRKTKQRFDYGNICQEVQDLMVRYEWISDDNATILKPIYIGFEHNKTKNGVLIRTI